METGIEALIAAAGMALVAEVDAAPAAGPSSGMIDRVLDGLLLAVVFLVPAMSILASVLDR